VTSLQLFPEQLEEVLYGFPVGIWSRFQCQPVVHTDCLVQTYRRVWCHPFLLVECHALFSAHSCVFSQRHDGTMGCGGATAFLVSCCIVGCRMGKFHAWVVAREIIAYRLNKPSLSIISMRHRTLHAAGLTSISIRIGQRGGAIVISVSCIAL
jgi:hypothetical protein